ncbi:unnamed protein product [Parnassius mnemosyne]|uniref:Uncharacterized protein n=1 Tax=Parnassius mnemosyne TaxID=213953 RepID=A0AAV1KSD7_9NEOP
MFTSRTQRECVWLVSPPTLLFSFFNSTDYYNAYYVAMLPLGVTGAPIVADHCASKINFYLFTQNEVDNFRNCFSLQILIKVIKLKKYVTYSVILHVFEEKCITMVRNSSCASPTRTWSIIIFIKDNYYCRVVSA